MAALARAYVHRLDGTTGVGRGAVLFAAESALDDDLRAREGRPSYEDEIVARAAR